MHFLVLRILDRDMRDKASFETSRTCVRTASFAVSVIALMVPTHEACNISFAPVITIRGVFGRLIMSKCGRMESYDLSLQSPWSMVAAAQGFCVQGAVYNSPILGDCSGKHHHALFPIFYFLFLLSLLLLFGAFPFEVFPPELAFWLPFPEQSRRVRPCSLHLGE